MRTATQQARERRLQWSGLAMSAVGLILLLGLASQVLADPADLGLLLVVCEAAAGVGLLIAGFVLMVVGADPFEDADAARNSRSTE